ncbi:MAG: phytanoyl-CoA dioxygenase family protein [Gammaproteobacteria bacterium]|nr:phytanoyl-CoA dioxygenase family protein [Gammaproteobacteria bacterium]
MPYPTCSNEQVRFFQDAGYLVVENAVAPDDVTEVREHCDVIVEKRHKLAFDWAWEKGTSREDRKFKIVQGSPSHIWPEINDRRFRQWMIEFAGELLGKGVEFWYDQYLAKPPYEGAETCWHQDEGYWGRNLSERGITCWLPLHDVDAENGCMHFIAGGHRDGVLEHFQPAHIQSDLLYCEPDISRTVSCPISLGSVTFHHSKTPHMTPPNKTGDWRRAVTTHMRAIGSDGEGDHYPWKVYVNQFTGERTIPPSR